MTSFGNIVYLRPRSVICGPSAARGARAQGRKGANKQYSQKKAFFLLLLSIHKAKLYPDI